jgi:hypothetical protein
MIIHFIKMYPASPIFEKGKKPITIWMGKTKDFFIRSNNSICSVFYLPGCKVNVK